MSSYYLPTHSISPIKAISSHSPFPDEMIDITLTPRKTKGRSSAKPNPPKDQGEQHFQPVATPPPRRLTRSTYEYVESKSSLPPRLETASCDGACDEIFPDDTASLKPMYSKVRPCTPVQLIGSCEYREGTVSSQLHLQGSRRHVDTLSPYRPRAVLGSPLRLMSRRTEQKGDGDAVSDWSSDYASPKDIVTHYLPTERDNDYDMGDLSSYHETFEHHSPSMTKHRQEIGQPRIPHAEPELDSVDHGWSSPYYATAPDRYPLSMRKHRQDSGQFYTPASGYSSPYVDAPAHFPLGYIPNYCARHLPEFEQPYTPRFGSNLKYTLRSSPPQPDEDFDGHEEWNEWDESPIWGGPVVRNDDYAQAMESPSPRAKANRSRKSRMTSYGLVGGARVYSTALEGLVDDESNVFEKAIETALPKSPAEENASGILATPPVEEFATGFAAHHDSKVWCDDMVEEPQSWQIQDKAANPYRHLSGATVVPSVEGHPRVLDDEPVMLVDYDIPAWYQVEARSPGKINAQKQVPSPQQADLPCAGAESCATRIARLEKQNELLTTKVEMLQDRNDFLHLFAVGVWGLFMGGAFVMARFL